MSSRSPASINMLPLIIALVTFAMGISAISSSLDIFSVMPPQTQTTLSNVPAPSITPVVSEEQTTQTISPTQSPTKEPVYNIQSGKMIENVSSSGVDHSPVLIPCSDPSANCSPTPTSIPMPTQTPTPTTIVSPTIPPTCVPRPSCLGSHPACMIAVTDNMCPPTSTPSPQPQPITSISPSPCNPLMEGGSEKGGIQPMVIPCITTQ